MQALHTVREYYLKRFADTIREQEEDLQVILEPSYRNAKGELVRNGALNLPMRGDMVLLRDGSPVESVVVDTEDMPKINPVGVGSVTIGPFQWNACAIRIEGTPADWTWLTDWFMKWFDPGDAKEPGEDGFFGVPHCVVDPETRNGATKLSIDLGSASVEAVKELIGLLGKLPGQVWIGGTV